jgi:hypothetical protein
MVIITVCFFWVREIFLIADKLHDDIMYNKKVKEAIVSGTPIQPKAGSVNTFHSIATAILCTAITIIHFAIFNNVMKLLVLVTISFFWIREIFKIANKVDGHFTMKRNERNALIQAEIAKARETSTK